jgi:hypothetical protein
MLGKPSRVAPVMVLAVALATGCGRGRAEPASTPPVSAVEVPAVPPETEHTRANSRRPERRLSPDEGIEESSLEIEIVEDAGAVHVSAASDGSIRFWGNFKKLDGGFSFQGGFSTGTGSSGAPDAGINGRP